MGGSISNAKLRFGKTNYLVKVCHMKPLGVSRASHSKSFSNLSILWQRANSRKSNTSHLENLGRWQKEEDVHTNICTLIRFHFQRVVMHFSCYGILLGTSLLGISLSFLRKPIPSNNSNELQPDWLAAAEVNKLVCLKSNLEQASSSQR